MLFLSRKVGESIVINDTTRITVLEVKRSGVKLGIECPERVRVYRQEVFDRIQQENKKALISNMETLFQSDKEDA